jgi:hypothetical protein
MARSFYLDSFGSEGRRLWTKAADISCAQAAVFLNRAASSEPPVASPAL